MTERAATEPTASFRLKAALAFAAVYIIWGSTYLAIRFAIETLPAFTMGGVRFMLAGGVLLAWAALRGAPRPTLRQVRSAAIIGGLLLLCGNGAVMWAEQRVPSGLAALLIGTEPLFVGLILWAWPGGSRPGARTALALLIGFAGTTILALGSDDPLGGSLHLPSVLALLFACTTWATGSVYAKEADLPSSPTASSGLQMLLGGALLLGFGILRGEPGHIDPGAFSTKSLLAVAYLIVFGSLIGFSAYGWLIRHVKPTLVATYAYVNPVVAILLGSLLAGEPFGLTTVVASALILLAVLLVSTDRSQHPMPKRARTEPEPEAASEPKPPLRQCA